MDVPASNFRAPRANPFKKPWFWIVVTAFVASSLLVGLGLRQRFFSAPPVVGALPAFHFVNQRGEPFGSEQLKGRVWIANFIFTRCPSICPKFTGELKKVQQRTVRDAGKLQLVSFSVDPEFDSAEVLAAYAQKYEADQRRWTFLTGEPGQVKETIIQGFKVALGRTRRWATTRRGSSTGRTSSSWIRTSTSAAITSQTIRAPWAGWSATRGCSSASRAEVSRPSPGCCTSARGSSRGTDCG